MDKTIDSITKLLEVMAQHKMLPLGLAAALMWATFQQAMQPIQHIPTQLEGISSELHMLVDLVKPVKQAVQVSND